MTDLVEREDGRDRWSTPWTWYRMITGHWNLEPTIDVCADQFNSKCQYFITEQENALLADWFKLAQDLEVAPIGWMNPPYTTDLMIALINKAIEESLKGFTTVFLLPSNVDRPWYHDLILEGDGGAGYEHKIIKGRIPFDPPPPIKPSSPRYGNIHGVIRPPEKFEGLSLGGSNWTPNLAPNALDIGMSPDWQINVKPRTWEDLL